LNLDKTILLVQRDVKIFETSFAERTYVFYVNEISQPSIMMLDDVKKVILELICSKHGFNSVNALADVVIQSNPAMTSRAKVIASIVELLDSNILHQKPSETITADVT